MAVRTTFSFDHMAPPGPTIPNVGNASPVMLGNMPVQYRAIGGSKALVVRPDGYIANQYTGLQTGGAAALVTAQVKSGAPKKSWFGCRLKMTVLGTISYPALILGTPAFVLNGATQGAMAFTFDMATTTNSGLLNKEFYVELGIDWINHTIERRVDGEFHSIITVPAAVATAMDAGTADVLMIGTYGGNNQCSFRDIYWADNLEDGSTNGPLGPQFTALLEEIVEEPTVWVPSAGTVQSVLSTKVDPTTNLNTPTLNSETGLAPLKVKFKIPDNVEAHSVTALTSFVSAGLAAAGTAELSTTLKQNNVETAPVVSSISATLQHCKLGPSRDKAPDGSNWTPEKVNSTVLSIKTA